MHGKQNIKKKNYVRLCVCIFIYIYIFISLNATCFDPYKVITRLKYLSQNIKMIHIRLFIELGSKN